MAAFIHGRPATLAEAVAQAAQVLGRARFPLVAGLACDVDGARAAIALAERLHGAFDHMHSDAVFNTLDVMRETGMMLTTPGEVRVRADTVLLVGQGVEAAWPQAWERLALHQPAALGASGPRRVIWIGGGTGAVVPGVDTVAAPAGAAALPAFLSALRARLAGRRLAAGLPLDVLDTIAAQLKGAKIGCAIWAQADLDPLATEMLCGLVFDLNKATRFSGLPLAPPGNATGVTLASGWMTGFPPRTGFGRGFPEHDPWRFSAQRLIANGEADAALWINVMDAAMPKWEVPLVAITGPSGYFAHPPAVQFIAGCPGVDHDGVLHDAATGMLLTAPATAPSAAPSVAAILHQIASAMPGGPLPC